MFNKVVSKEYSYYTAMKSWSYASVHLLSIDSIPLYISIGEYLLQYIYESKETSDTGSNVLLA